MSKTGLTRDGRYRMALGSRIRYGRTATRIGNWREQRAWARGRHEMARAHPEPGKRHRMSIRTRVSDWRADRTVERGRRDVFRRAADQIRSKTPVYRGRPNPVYAGRPHSRDAVIGRGIDAGLARELAARRLDARARHPSVRTRDSEGRTPR